jgi:hypothetical protein
MDNLRDLIKINLKDTDGIIVGGTTYKLANGSNIMMMCKGYPAITWDNYINSQENLHIKITTTKTLSDTLGPVKFSGNIRPTIKLHVYVPISEDVPTRAQYAAMTGSTFLSFYLLYNMWRYPHRMYLNDLLDNSVIPRVDYPLNILINNNDLLDQTIFTSAGVPVILKRMVFTGEGYITHEETKNQEAVMEYDLEFMVDNYGT